MTTEKGWGHNLKRILFTSLAVGLFLGGSPQIVKGVSPPVSTQETQNMKGLVFVGQLSLLSEAKFNAVLNSRPVQYVLFQVIRSNSPSENLETELALLRERVAALKEHGKKPILQIWWGGRQSTWSWELWSLPNIAQDPRLRASFFQQVTDPIINALRPENLYGVHLMEEVGLQFGSDADQPGECGPDVIPEVCGIDRHHPDCPREFSDGDATLDLDSYTAPRFSSYFCTPEDCSNNSRGMCNIRRHRGRFEQETGKNIDQAEGWFLDLWVGKRLVSEALVAFARHLHSEYSGLKAFSWHFPGFAPYLIGDTVLLSENMDGFIMNPYGGPASVYRNGRFFRLFLAPDKELLYLGGIGESSFVHTIEDRRKMATLAYLIGADAFGFFNLPWLSNQTEEAMAGYVEDLQVLKKIGTIPVLKNQPHILLISNVTASVYGDPYQLTSLKRFDYATPREASAIDIAKYDLVILFESQGGGAPEMSPSEGSLRHWGHGLGAEFAEFDDAALDRYIRNGGCLAVIGGWDLGSLRPVFSKDYIVFDTFYYDTNREALPHPLPETFSPDSWFAKKFKIGIGTAYTSYTSILRRKIVSLSSDPPSVVHQVVKGDPALGIYYQRDLGGVLILPTNLENGGQDWNTGSYVGRRRYLADLLCGMARYHGKKKLLDEMLCPNSGEGEGLLFDRTNFPNRGEIEAAVMISGDLVLDSRCQGKDLWTGQPFPRLTTERSSYLCLVKAKKNFGLPFEKRPSSRGLLR